MLAAPSTCICKTPTVRVSRRSSPVAAAIGTSARLHASETASAASAAPGCSRQSSLKTRAWRDIACRARCNLSSVAASAAIASSTLSLGIDCGTSGARAILIDGKFAQDTRLSLSRYCLGIRFQTRAQAQAVARLCMNHKFPLTSSRAKIGWGLGQGVLACKLTPKQSHDSHMQTYMFCS